LEAAAALRAAGGLGGLAPGARQTAGSGRILARALSAGAARAQLHDAIVAQTESGIIIVDQHARVSGWSTSG
jgi:hypothetical protein